MSEHLVAIDSAMKRLAQFVDVEGDAAPHVTFDVQIVSGQNPPDSLLSLRREVFQQETNFLSDTQLWDENDELGEHVLVFEKSSGKLVASTTMVDGELSDFSKHSGVPATALRHTFYSTRSTVLPAYRSQSLFAFIIHVALRHNKLKGRTKCVCYSEAGAVPSQRLVRYTAIAGGKSRAVRGENGREYSVYPFELDIDDSLIRTFNRLEESLQNWVRSNCYGPELVEVIRAKVAKFYDNEYFRQVNEQRLSKVQYVECLANSHQFVRWTTRILGRVVANCNDTDLRRHYASHLSGEVNHEIWLENDLDYLDGDVDFVKNDMVANKGTRMFMQVQESLAAFDCDPVLFLAVPIAIEGVTAFMSQEFIENLRACIKKWGFEKPSAATTFFASHVHTDGADDGHWAATFKVMQKYVRTETEHQRIVQIIDLVFDALSDCYDDFVRFPDLSQAIAGVSTKPDLRPELN